MFKKAYVRGIQGALVQAGHAAYPDEDSAAKIADYIADNVDFDVMNGFQAASVSREVTAKIAEHLIDASAELAQQGYRPGPTAKVASQQDLSKVAQVHALHLMKLAEGSNYEGGDKGNTERTTAEGKMDEKARPDGYAAQGENGAGGAGKTEVDTRPGAVGKEEPHPAAPANSPSGDNTVIDASKTSSLAEALRKIAMGSNIEGGDKGNKEPTTAEGKMDLAARPAGYAVLPHQGAPGAIPGLVTGPAIVGKEMAMPNGPSRSVDGSNSLTQHSAKAAGYVEVFRKAAREIVPYLPNGLGEDEKIGHIQAMMDLDVAEKAHYIHGLHQKIASKTAANANPEFVPGSPKYTSGYSGYDGAKANQKKAEDGGLPAFMANMSEKEPEKKDSEKKDDKCEKCGKSPCECKKDDDKKEASDLGLRLRAIVNAAASRA